MFRLGFWNALLTTIHLLLQRSDCEGYLLTTKLLSSIPLHTQLHSRQSDHSFEFHVAPMQCYTNAAMRQLFSALSPDAKLWTEMEKVQDLILADPSALERRFGRPGHKDVVLQLGGNDEEALSNCIRRLSNHGYTFEEINLNCGCPSVESGGAATYGASLMKKPRLTRDLLKAISETKPNHDTVVSLKCRIAVHDNPQAMSGDMLSEREYEALYEYLSHACQGNMNHLVLHARAAVLSGLSPKKNRQVPVLDYRTVYRVSRDFPVHVTLNGGISSMGHLDKLIRNSTSTGISSFMSGRWMLRHPLDLARVQCFLSQQNIAADSGDFAINPSRKAVEAVEQYTNFISQCLQQPTSNQICLPTINELCLPLYLITEQIRDAYDYDEDFIEPVGITESWLEYEDIEKLYDTICEALVGIQEAKGLKQKKFSASSIEFNKLSTTFKGLVGTKVANKWKRNRAEF